MDRLGNRAPEASPNASRTCHNVESATPHSSPLHILLGSLGGSPKFPGTHHPGLFWQNTAPMYTIYAEDKARRGDTPKQAGTCIGNHIVEQLIEDPRPGLRLGHAPAADLG